MKTALMLVLFVALAPLWVPIVLVRISITYASAVFEAFEAYITKWTP